MLGRLTMLVLATLLLAACGGDDGAGGDGARDAGDGGAATTAEGGTPIAEPGAPDETGAPLEAQSEGTLEVVLRNVGQKDGAGLPPPVGISCTRSLPATCRETVTCPVAEDGVPADQRTCAWLRAEGLELLLEEPSGAEVCTEVYGGPELATVRGTVDGQEVDATFSREDGCAIARYDAVAPLWTGVIEPSIPADAGAGAAAGACPVLDPDAPVSSADPAAGAADEACPGGPVTGQPQVVEDPPEAFELER